MQHLWTQKALYIKGFMVFEMAFWARKVSGTFEKQVPAVKPTVTICICVVFFRLSEGTILFSTIVVQTLCQPFLDIAAGLLLLSLVSPLIGQSEFDKRIRNSDWSIGV